MNGSLGLKNVSEPLAIHPDEVHIWSARLDVPPAQQKIWELYLSRDELQRAARYHFDRDRNHFIVARGVLRKILSYYTHRKPYEIRFDYNKYGKPLLPPELGGRELHFNLSHSAGIGVYAVAFQREVGIDIEYIRPDFSELDIADRFFSPDEVKILRSLPLAEQKKAFFLCWTRKEAFIKAKGQGLSIPLDQFDVSLIPGHPAKLLKTRYDHYDVNRWTLFDIAAFPNYAGAVAVEGRNCQLKFQYSSEF